jgi:hypothetical protein
MNSTTLRYDLGPAHDVDATRPTLSQLQRAQAHALAAGDRRRAAVYALVVRHRLEAAQHAAAA